MKTVLTLTFLAALHASVSSAEPTLKLVEDGEPKCAIVLAREPSQAATRGANSLADHLGQISGAKIPILRPTMLGKVAVAPDGRLTVEKLPAVETFLLVGKSPATELLGLDVSDFKPAEIVIKSFPNAVAMLGADGLTPVDAAGTQYAVNTFLEDTLGVRFLWPGELGKVVPQRETITIPAIDHRFAPILTQRRIRMVEGYGTRMAQGGDKLNITAEEFNRVRTAAIATESRDGGWARWHRMGGSLRLASGHSFGDYWERFGKTHPEWFAMAPNGSRDQSRSPDRARLCVSNKELIAQVARDRIARIDKTGQKSVTIGPNDGGQTAFCSCPECRALDAPTDRKTKNGGVPLTDRYVHFFNEVTEQVVAKHPDVWVTADAYSLYASPPVKAKLHPNIAIRYVGVTYTDNARRLQNLEDWHAWADAASKVFFRSNLLLAGRRQGTPVIYVHKLAEDFPKLAKNKMIGTDLDSCCNNWATQGLNYYVMAKLLWDPDLDINALVDDYCQAGFGAGADTVKAYFLKLEELTDEMSTTEKNYTEPYTPEVVAELRSLLDEADAATEGDHASNKRVAFLRAGLEYTDGFCEIHRIHRAWEASGEKRYTKEWRARLHAACNHNWRMSRKVFEDHHLAVNIPNVAWGSWGYFGRFGWNPSALKESAHKEN